MLFTSMFIFFFFFCFCIIQESMDIKYKLKSITIETAASCTIHLCGALKREIDDVEYFITKCRSFYGKYKIGGQGEQHGNKCK